VPTARQRRKGDMLHGALRRLPTLAAIAIAGFTGLQAAPVRAQSACTLDAVSLFVTLPGGGGFLPPPGTRHIVTPFVPVSMGIHCEGSGQFPPPVAAGASYAWTTGETTQRIEAPGLAPGQRRPYAVRVITPAGERAFDVILEGAAASAPICRVATNEPQPVRVGTTFVVVAECEPAATEWRWDARTFLGTLAFAGPSSTQATALTLLDGQPGAVFPVYLVASNGAGPAPYASFLVTVGESSAALPKNPPALALGGDHSCALTSAGGARCWGDDQSGQLGDYRGALLYSTTPVNGIGLSTGLARVVSGSQHACALTAGGNVRCWGANNLGQLGDGTLTRAYQQVQVAGLAFVVDIGSGPGSHHTCAVLANARLACWGLNDVAQLGDGTTVNRPSFVISTATQEPVRMVATGAAHTCVLTVAGAVQCWGRNSDGQLGDGTTDFHPTAVTVRGLDGGVVAITAGHSHNCALLRTGAVRCWGSNVSGQVGFGSSALRSTVAVDVVGLQSGVTRVSAGLTHSCAVTAAGAALCWGGNADGQLGDGTLGRRDFPVAVRALASGVREIAAGGAHSCAMVAGGGVLCWGNNGSGRLGDATSAGRTTPQLVVGALARGFLDITLEDGFTPPPDRVPVFGAFTSGSFTDITARIEFRPEDIGRTANVYVFALAPASQVRGAHEPGLPLRKDVPVQCVLAQLDASGRLIGVGAQDLQAYVSGVLGAQGQAVNILNGVPAANIAGATFFVGYGATAGAMLDGGTNRSVVSIPGPVRCQPQAPQAGWWWNPAEGGRGYSLEVQGNKIFFAAFHYEASGRPTWHVATGLTSLEGSLYQGPLLRAEGGQTLAGAYPGAPRLTTEGPITLAFSDATHGTMIWPGGVVPIERMNIVPRGLDAAPRPNQPENGWWWNPEESGRGFFIEWQDGSADLAGYMYDEAGQPVWYLSVYETPDLSRFGGNWWSYANGQAMGAAYRPATRVSDHVAPVAVQFTAPDRAVMTLPGGRQLALTRHRF
jgi:alpha-tubulin suppressor-like RCC1 family protein